jgi:ATP-dependent Clp protease adaptor protein ClpS
VAVDTPDTVNTAATPASGKSQQSANEKAPKGSPTDHPKKLPQYRVVLLDDNDHSYAYVIMMLHRLFRMPYEVGYHKACELDTAKRVVLLETSKEHAELKQMEIHGFGADQLIPRCKGSMTAVIEPVEG